MNNKADKLKLDDHLIFCDHFHGFYCQIRHKKISNKFLATIWDFRLDINPIEHENYDELIKILDSETKQLRFSLNNTRGTGLDDFLKLRPHLRRRS